MATKRKIAYHPDTPPWFKPLWEQHSKEHEELRKDFKAEMQKMRSDLPKQIIKGLKSTYATGSGNAYSHDLKD